MTCDQLNQTTQLSRGLRVGDRVVTGQHHQAGVWSR